MRPKKKSLLDSGIVSAGDKNAELGRRYELMLFYPLDADERMAIKPLPQTKNLLDGSGCFAPVARVDATPLNGTARA